jgi:DNA polymerase-4
VARTKHLAKIASQVAKPDGLVVVDPETELNFLHDLPVELMWGVGPVMGNVSAEVDAKQ